jgi:hypothetical protein
MSKENMQQALTVLKAWDALIKYQYGGSSEAMTAMQNVAWRTLDTIEGLEAKLAKPEQEPEPAAWMYPSTLKDFEHGEKADYAYSIQVGCPDEKSVPLYTAPPRKPWQGLTDEEQYQIVTQCGAMSADWQDFVIAVEQKLKDKNDTL